MFTTIVILFVLMTVYIRKYIHCFTISDAHNTILIRYIKGVDRVDIALWYKSSCLKVTLSNGRVRPNMVVIRRGRDGGVMRVSVVVSL